MKQNLLKTCLVMLLAVLGWGSAWADEETITLANGVGTGSGTSYSITWSGTSCDITQTKESSNTSVNSSYISAPRWYASHKIAFKAKSGFTLTGVTVVCTSNAYATELKNSTYSNGASATVSSSTVTITTDGDFDVTMGAQSRISSIKVAYTSNGGSTPTTTYKVTVANNIANGTVTANPTSAAAGATVKLTATPDDGYEFGEWSVKGADNTTITVTNNQFTMPAQNVTVSATFNAETPAVVTDKTIAEFIAAEGGKCYLTGTVSNIKNTTYGNFDLTDASGTIYIYGCLNKDGEAQKFAELGVEAGDKIKVLADTYEVYKDTKEAKNVIFVEIVEKGAVAQYTVTVAEGIVNGTVKASAEKAAEGDEVTLTATPADGYVFGEWNVKGANNTTISVTNNKFTMPAQNVTVSATFTKEAPSVTFDLSKDNTVAATEKLLAWTSSYASMYAEKGKASTATNNYYPGTAGKTYSSTRFYASSSLTFNPAPGVTISSIVYEATSADYATKLKNSTWTNAAAVASNTTVTIKPADGTKPVVAAVGGTTGATSVKIFYSGVPTADPYLPSTTEPEPEPTVYTITVNQDTENGSVSASAASAVEGTVITLTATPADGYELEEYIVTRTDNNAELTVSDNKFTMPAANVSVTATFKAVTGGEPTPDAGEGVYVLTDLKDIKANDVVIITMTNSKATYAMSNANGASAAPTAVKVAVSDNKITIDNSDILWNIDYNNGSFVAYVNGNNSNWLYCTNSNNGVRVGTGNAKTFSINKGYMYEEGTTEARYIGVYNDADFRCYNSNGGNIANQTLAFYVKSTSASAEHTLTLVAQDSKSDYYCTFSADKDVIFLANQVAEVQTVYTDGDEILLESLSDESWAMVDGVEGTESYGYYVPANTGVIICSANAKVKYYDVTSYDYNQNASDFSDNMLVAASVAMTGDNLFYKLAYDNYEAKTGLGFYWGAADGAAFTCKAGTAYLAVPKSLASNLRGFSFDGEGCTTGIKAIATDKADNASIYNLQGQRVVYPERQSKGLQQGVNIVNGKKVIR